RLHATTARPRALPADEWQRQPADGENLVRTHAVVIHAANVIDVDDIGQETARIVPEARQKRGAAAVERVAPRRDTARREPERVQPERLNLHRLADPRG